MTIRQAEAKLLAQTCTAPLYTTIVIMCVPGPQLPGLYNVRSKEGRAYSSAVQMTRQIVTPYYKFTTGDWKYTLPAVVHCRRINTHVTGIIIASVHILRKQPAVLRRSSKSTQRNGLRRSIERDRNRPTGATEPSRDSFRPTTARRQLHVQPRTGTKLHASRGTARGLANPYATRTPGPLLVDAAIIWG